MRNAAQFIRFRGSRANKIRFIILPASCVVIESRFPRRNERNIGTCTSVILRKAGRELEIGVETPLLGRVFCVFETLSRLNMTIIITTVFYSYTKGRIEEIAPPQGTGINPCRDQDVYWPVDLIFVKQKKYNLVNHANSLIVLWRP